MSEQKSEEISSNENRSGGRGPLYVAIGAAILGLLLVCIFAFFIFCPNGECLPAGNQTPTPTPIIRQQPPLDLATPEAIIEIEGADPITLTLDTPSVLTIAGQDFPVQPASPDINGAWLPTVGNPTTSYWLNGTVINYVFAIQDTADNRAMVTALERGDEIAIVAQSGEQRTFIFNSRNIVPASQRDVFAQNSPSITLVLTGAQNTDRVVVKGSYQVEQAVPNIGPDGGNSEDNIAQLGDVVQLGNIQIVANVFDNRPIEGSDFAFYLIDYQIQNIGTGPLDTSQIEMTLVDSIGTIYPMNIEASQVGNHAPLSPQLGAGSTAEATAGYQIPNSLDYNSLGWVVERADTGDAIEIRVAANGSGGDTGEANFTVQILANPPQLSPDAAQIFMTGTIANAGGETAIIDASDVNFVSDGANYLILSTKPPFPWVVQPNEVLEYELAVQRPIGTDLSTFTILNQSFQVTNYR